MQQMRLKHVLLAAAAGVAAAARPETIEYLRRRGWPDMTTNTFHPSDAAMFAPHCNIERRPDLGPEEFARRYRDRQPVIIGDRSMVYNLTLADIADYIETYGEDAALLRHGFRRGEGGSFIASLQDHMNQVNSVGPRKALDKRMRSGDVPEEIAGMVNRMVWDDDAVMLTGSITDTQVMTTHPQMWRFFEDRLLVARDEHGKEIAMADHVEEVEDKNVLRTIPGDRYFTKRGLADEDIDDYIAAEHVYRVIPSQLCDLWYNNETAVDQCNCDVNLMLGSESGRGLAIHYHGMVPGNLHVFGFKRWIMFRDHIIGGNNHRRSTYEWFQTIYPKIPKEAFVRPPGHDSLPQIFECTLGPGDVLYVPNGFFHGTLGVGHEFNAVYECSNSILETTSAMEEMRAMQFLEGRPARQWVPNPPILPPWRNESYVPALLAQINAGSKALTTSDNNPGRELDLQAEKRSKKDFYNEAREVMGPWHKIVTTRRPTFKGWVRGFMTDFTGLATQRWQDLMNARTAGTQVVKLQHITNIFPDDAESTHHLGVCYLRRAFPLSDFPMEGPDRDYRNATGENLVNLNHVNVTDDGFGVDTRGLNVHFVRMAIRVLTHTINTNPLFPDTHTLLARAHIWAARWLRRYGTLPHHPFLAQQHVDRGLSVARRAQELEPYSNGVCNQLVEFLMEGGLEGVWSIDDAGLFHRQITLEKQRSAYDEKVKHGPQCKGTQGPCMRELDRCFNMGRKVLRSAVSRDTTVSITSELRNSALLLHRLLGQPVEVDPEAELFEVIEQDPVEEEEEEETDDVTDDEEDEDADSAEEEDEEQIDDEDEEDDDSEL